MTSPHLSRRDWLQAVRRRRRRPLAVRLARAAGRRRREGPAAQAVVHPAVDERRPEPDRHCSTSSPATPTAGRSRRSRPASPASGSASTCRRSPSTVNDLAVIRSMSTKEGDHGRATYLLRTGYLPQGPIQYPTLGSLVSKELGDDDGRAAELRQHRPVPLLQPGGLRPGLPRAAVRPADRRRRRQLRRPAAGPTTPTAPARCRTSTGPATCDQAQADARLDLLAGDGAATSSADRPGVVAQQPPRPPTTGPCG